MFSVVRPVLLQSLPYPDADRYRRREHRHPDARARRGTADRARDLRGAGRVALPPADAAARGANRPHSARACCRTVPSSAICCCEI
jgi:hypothetical protein